MKSAKFSNFCWYGIKNFWKNLNFKKSIEIVSFLSLSLSLSLPLCSSLALLLSRSLVFNPNQFCFYFLAIVEETWQRVNKDVCSSPFEGKNFESIQNWCFLPSHSGLSYVIGCINLNANLQTFSMCISMFNGKYLKASIHNK